MSWVVMIISILLFNSIVFFMKKRIKISEIYTTVLFGLFVSSLVDDFASFRFKAWGFFDVNDTEFKILLILLGIYPAVAAMIVNWYPYKSNRKQKLLYLMGWAVFSTSYEWLTLKTGILWHKNWNLFYSFVMYPFIYYMLIFHVKLFRHINKDRLDF